MPVWLHGPSLDLSQLVSLNVQRDVYTESAQENTLCKNGLQYESRHQCSFKHITSSARPRAPQMEQSDTRPCDREGGAGRPLLSGNLQNKRHGEK